MLKNLISISVGFLFCVAIAAAQSTTVDLSTLVAELQKTPTDNALREKIIKLAASMKELPPLPDEALRHEGRGNAAFKNAKDVEGFISAAKEFEAASLIAPWIPGYYSDMCTAYEKGGALAEAYWACWLYSLGLSDEKEIREAKLRTAAVEYEYQKYSGAELQKLNNSKKPLQAVDGIPSGQMFFCNNNNYHSGKDVFQLGPKGLAPYGREEYWLVRNGSKASAVVVFWVSAESISELMKGGVIVKNPLIKVFPGKLEVENANHTVYTTDSMEASSIEFSGENEPIKFAGIYRFAGLGRPKVVSALCEPID